MGAGRANSVAAADDRAGAGVLALKDPVLAPDAGVRLATVDVGGAARLLDAEALLTGVEQRTLAGLLALGHTGATHTDLIVETLSG